MRNMRLGLCSGVMAIALFPVSANAQESSQATGQASASVVRIISAQPQAMLAFGALTVNQQSGGEVVVYATGGSATYNGAVRPACGASSGCSPHPARFSVTGEPRHGYRISLPVSIQATGSRSGQMLEVTGLVAFSPSRPDVAGTGQLDGAGQDQFLVGGTLTVPAGSPADFYATDLPVTVAYD